MDAELIIPYLEPIYRFCCRRLDNRHDAEDLSSEIVCHILDGMKKYEIASLDAWVWRIARNRYSRFIDSKRRLPITFTDNDTLLDIACRDYTSIDEEELCCEYDTIFRRLHTLSREYRDIFVDHYLNSSSIKQLAAKYSLSEATVKWRLNAGRQKLRERIGDKTMDRVYKRINWYTDACNGSMDSSKYLHSQISRAICLAAYEKPLTVEEISIATGIPTVYIEDELPRLEYGDAIGRFGSKYAASFIILRLCDRKMLEEASSPLVCEIADRLESVISKKRSEIEALTFFGHDFGAERLGYIFIPYILRKKIRTVKNDRLKLQNGPFPPRKDGGYGWFIIEETPDESESISEYSTGCNFIEFDNSDTDNASGVYYYFTLKYFDSSVPSDCGSRLAKLHSFIRSVGDGIIPHSAIPEDDAAHLLCNGIILKYNDAYKLNIPCFTKDEFIKFTSLFELSDAHIDNLLADWLSSIRNSFEQFVPARLAPQINQWVSCYAHQLIGHVTEALISRGALRKPDADKPLTDGVFYVSDSAIHP